MIEKIVSGSFETIWRNVSNIIVEKVFLTPDLESESIDDDGDDGDLNNNPPRFKESV